MLPKNEDFHERLEELELSWADDFHISEFYDSEDHWFYETKINRVIL